MTVIRLAGKQLDDIVLKNVGVTFANSRRFLSDA